MMSSWITVGVMALIVIGAVKLIGRVNYLSLKGGACESRPG